MNQRSSFRCCLVSSSLRRIRASSQAGRDGFGTGRERTDLTGGETSSGGVPAEVGEPETLAAGEGRGLNGAAGELLVQSLGAGKAKFVETRLGVTEPFVSGTGLLRLRASLRSLIRAKIKSHGVFFSLEPEDEPIVASEADSVGVLGDDFIVFLSQLANQFSPILHQSVLEPAAHLFIKIEVASLGRGAQLVRRKVFETPTFHLARARPAVVQILQVDQGLKHFEIKLGDKPRYLQPSKQVDLGKQVVEVETVGKEVVQGPDTKESVPIETGEDQVVDAVERLLQVFGPDLRPRLLPAQRHAVIAGPETEAAHKHIECGRVAIPQNRRNRSRALRVVERPEDVFRRSVALLRAYEFEHHGRSKTRNWSAPRSRWRMTRWWAAGPSEGAEKSAPAGWKFATGLVCMD